MKTHMKRRNHVFQNKETKKPTHKIVQMQQVPSDTSVVGVWL
jgi:hypothetical protein